MSHVDPALRQVMKETLQTAISETCNSAMEKLSQIGQVTLVQEESKTDNRTQQHVIEWMKQHHYNLEFLDEANLGFALTTNAPVLIDQLIVLERSLEDFDRETREAILGYAKTLVKHASSNANLDESHNTEPEVLKVLETLGILTFLIDTDPQLVEKHARVLKNQFDQLKAAYIEHNKGLSKKLLLLKEAHKDSGIQSAERALSIRLPHYIAEQILTRKGFVNIGMIAAWMHQPLIPDNNYGATLKQRLNQLFDSPLARSELARIHIPSNPKAPIYDVVRASLNLPDRSVLNHYHARLAALTAALTHIRQFPSNSCFSLVVCLTQLSTNIAGAITDFRNLIASSALHREIGTRTHQFSFLTAIPNMNIDTKIQVNSTGLINGGPLHLWEALGIIAACKAIGIIHPQEAIEKLLPLKKEETTVRQILELLSPQNEKTLRRSYFAFEAQTTNALLGVWSNAIGGMAEAKLSGMLKSQLFRAIMFALDVDYKGIKEDQSELIDWLRLTILESLINKACYLYDPFLSAYSYHQDLRYRGSGFVLYDRINETDIARWPRIDKAPLFQAFISKIILESGQSLAGIVKSKETADFIIKVAQHLSAYTHSDRFINRLMMDFTQEQPPYNMKDAPWMTHDGNDTEKTLSVYYEENQHLKKHTIKANNAQQLFKALIVQGRNIYKTHQKLFKPDARTPVRVEELHAFSLMFGHPSLKAFWNKDADIDEWVESNLTSPGKEVANSMVKRDKIIEIGTHFKKKFFDRDNEKAKLFLRRLEQPSEELTVAKLRHFLVEILKKLKPDLSETTIKTSLDPLILEALPRQLKAKITERAVHIADTNWSNGEHDVHFCCLYNPCSEKIELWQSWDNNKKLKPLDQDQWVADQDWEFYCP